MREQVTLPEAEPPLESPEDALLRLYGLRGFRPLQRPIVHAMLAGRDVMAVLPTGAGKSLCFQLPALMDSGLTLVVSPLISLMQDQVAGLRGRGLPAGELTSGTAPRVRRATLEALQAGRLRLLYSSPEMLSGARFHRMWGDRSPARIVVDEAHCISEWGHDFRPAYRRIRDFADRHGRPPIAAFTATATRHTREDIEGCLGLRAPLRVIASVDRPNIHWAAERAWSRSEAIDRIAQALRQALRRAPGGAALVYVPTRDGASRAAESLRRRGHITAYYHAGMEDSVRRAVLERFLAGEVPVVCATSAFGMGIDHPRIRLVCHCGVPGALESYVQEAGRAGRDGLPARAILLATPSDRALQKNLIRASAAGRESRRRARDRLTRMYGYLSTRRCRRAYIASYFGESPPRCGGCDRCGGQATVSERGASTICPGGRESRFQA